MIAKILQTSETSETSKTIETSEMSETFETSENSQTPETKTHPLNMYGFYFLQIMPDFPNMDAIIFFSNL